MIARVTSAELVGLLPSPLMKTFHQMTGHLSPVLMLLVYWSVKSDMLLGNQVDYVQCMSEVTGVVRCLNRASCNYKQVIM